MSKRNPKVSTADMRRALRTSDPYSTAAVAVETQLTALDADLTTLEEDDTRLMPDQTLIVPTLGHIVVCDAPATFSWQQRGETIPIMATGAALIWTNMPAALTELFGASRHRTKIRLNHFAEARITANVVVVGAVNSKLRPEYSLDASAWASLCTSDGATISDLSPGGILVSSWGTIVSAAQTDVYLRVVGLDGDGVIDPSFGTITIQVR